jgi:hypothetical protein
VFSVETEKKQFDNGSSYIVNVKYVRATTTEEKAEGGALAVEMRRGNVVDNAETTEAGDKTVEPDAKGGAAI